MQDIKILKFEGDWEAVFGKKLKKNQIYTRAKQLWYLLLQIIWPLLRKGPVSIQNVEE